MTNKYSYSKILDDDTEAALVQASSNLSSLQWAIGDALLEKLEQFKKSETPYKPADIAKAIGAFSGFRAEQVLGMAKIAKFFPQAVRDQYPSLSYGHFAKAAGKEDWKDALEWCLKQADVTGRPATVDAFNVMYRFKGAGKIHLLEGENPVEQPSIDPAKAQQAAVRKACRELLAIIGDVKTGKLPVNSKVIEHLTAAVSWMELEAYPKDDATAPANPIPTVNEEWVKHGTDQES